MCAPVMVELEGETDPLQIAMKELKYALSFLFFMITIILTFFWIHCVVSSESI